MYIPMGRSVTGRPGDGKYAHMLEPWSQTEDFVFRTSLNRLYRARLRIEKLDAETGEQILHDEAVFALYEADRNEEKDGRAVSVKRYETETVIQGSRPFLEAMGARGIMPFARIPGMEAYDGNADTETSSRSGTRRSVFMEPCLQERLYAGKRTVLFSGTSPE